MSELLKGKLSDDLLEEVTGGSGSETSSGMTCPRCGVETPLWVDYEDHGQWYRKFTKCKHICRTNGKGGEAIP